ncbi:MAG: DUF2993 domain-containing protein [Mycobacteriales bacterium]
MKRIAISLVVLLGLLLVADRAAAAFAAQAVAAQAQAAAGLRSEPDVDVGGFPFLTQALAGRYTRVEVRADVVTAGEITLNRLEATLDGAQVPLSDALSGSVEQVPVDGIRARAVVGYDELSRRSGDRQLVVSPAGGQLRVTGSVQVLGREVSATALSDVEVVEGDLVVSAQSFEVGHEAVDELLTRALRGRLDLRIPVTGLPYGLQVTGVEVQAEGLVFLASSGPTVLRGR